MYFSPKLVMVTPKLSGHTVLVLTYDLVVLMRDMRTAMLLPKVRQLLQ